MKVFDYFYENYFLPLVENITYTAQVIWDVFLIIIGWCLVAALFISMPLWFIPYLVISEKRKKQLKRRLSNET